MKIFIITNGFVLRVLDDFQNYFLLRVIEIQSTE